MRVVQFFFREVRCKTGRVVREADPYGGVIDGAVGRGDVGIAPYGEHCMKCGEAGRRGRRPPTEALLMVRWDGAMWASPPTEALQEMRRKSWRAG